MALAPAHEEERRAPRPSERLNMANAMTAMGVTTLLFVNMSVSRAASQTAEDLYQVDRLNGGPAWQRQCALSEKDCMRGLSQVALQLAFDLAGESAGTSPQCSEKLQAAINSSCDVCVSPVCSAGGSVPVIGLEHHQMMQGFFSPEQKATLQVIGPTFDWPTPQRTTRARAEERGCSFHRCRTKFKTSSYFTVSDCSGKPKRKIAVPLTRDWALSSLPDSTACVPEACKKRPNGLFRIVECVNNLWVPTAAYLLQRTWSGTENCSAADSLQQHGLRLLDAIMAGVCLPEIDFDATTASGSTIVDASSGQQVNASMRSSFRRYDCSAGELRSGCKAGCDELHGPCAIVTPLHLARYKVVRMSSNDECGITPSQEVVIDKRASHPAASDAIPISVVGHGSTVCPTSVCARDESTLEYCSGGSPATKIDKSKCFKTVQACPDEYPGIPGTAMGIPGRFLVMQRWVKQDFSVGAGNGTGGECMPESEPNFRYALEDGVCLPMLWPRNNRFWLVDVGAQVLKSDCHDAGCTKCPTLQKLDQLAGFSAKKGSFGICTAHVDASGALLWSSAYISGDPKDKTSDAFSMYARGASSKILPVVVAGAVAALLHAVHA